MSEQVNTRAVDLVGIGTREDELPGRRLIGELVVGIRIDSLPASEAKRLADEGKFHPLTLDKDGNLRVVTPDWLKVEPKELEVLLRIEGLLQEQVALLRKIA